MQKCASIVTRKIADQTILLPLRPNSDGLFVYELNETAAFLWDLIDGKTDLEGLASQLADEFALATTEAKQDVREFIDAMRQLGAVT